MTMTEGNLKVLKNTVHTFSCREGSASLQCGERGHASGAGGGPLFWWSVSARWVATSSKWTENTYKRLYKVANAVDLPTFGSNLWHMQVNGPYMDHLGYI